jgi:hypothetical protein
MADSPLTTPSTDPTPKPASGGGCLLLGFVVLLGFMFVASVLSVPLFFFLPHAGMSDGARIGITLGCALQAAFWGYACRGALRSYRGQPGGHLIPPGLLRPVAFTLGVVFTVVGVGGLVAGQRGTGRAIGFGLAMVAFAIVSKKRPAAPGA